MITENQREILDELFNGWADETISVAQLFDISADADVTVRQVQWYALDKGIVPLRYSRNIGSIGIAGQKRLVESSCLIVGLGGLGGFVCEELARVGVGAICGVDHDAYDESNLNRQLNSSEASIGLRKSEQTKLRIDEVNSLVEFSAYDSKFVDVGDDVWGDVDIVIDCLDSIADRLVLAEKCGQAGKVMVHGAVAGWYGEAGVVWPGSGLLEDVYKNQRQGMEKELGTPVFTAATAGSIMTAEAVKVLIGKAAEGQNRIHFFDLMNDVWETVTM